MTTPVFPVLPGIAYPVKRTAVWNTLKQEAISGAVTRVPLYSYPRYQYELSFEFLRATLSYPEWQQLEAFYNSVNGAGSMFLFDDPSDDTAAGQNFGAGDGSTVTFQLVRSLGGFTVPVFCPNVITDIKVSGVPTSSYTLGSYGQITFSAAPTSAAPLTWDGSFRWPCFFDDDSLDFSEFLYQLWEIKSLKFTTVKL